jgi:hypothetical protein
MKAFLKWLEDQISDISPLPANVTSAMAQTAYFWNSISRVDIEWIFSSGAAVTVIRFLLSTLPSFWISTMLGNFN